MWAPDRVVADLERLALRAPTRAEFFDEAALRLKRAVPFAAKCRHRHRRRELKAKVNLNDSEFGTLGGCQPPIH